MIIRKRNRGGGKTKLLVEWAAKDPTRVVVVATEADASRVRRVGAGFARPPSLRPEQVYSVGSLIAGGVRLRSDRQYAVDDIERVFAQLLGAMPYAGTVTHDDIARMR